MEASQLINDAWYLSGIYSRNLESVDGEGLGDGLTLLQDILDETAINGVLVPYYKHIEVPTVPDQEEYFISGLIELTTMTFNLDNVRYSMTRDTQRQYFGNSRVDNISSLPYHFYAERENNGMRIYLYFLPDKVYPLNITGKFKFDTISFESELNDQLESFYISYLKYYLAKRMCDFRGYSFSEQKNKALKKLEYQITNLTGVDLIVRKSRQFRASSGIDYPQQNIGKGWRP